MLRAEKSGGVYRFTTNNTYDTIKLIKWIYSFPNFLPSSEKINKLKEELFIFEMQENKNKDEMNVIDNQLRSILGSGTYRPFDYDV